MEDLEQENHEFRDEVTTLRVGVERLTALVESLVVARNQPSPPSSPRATQTQTEVQTTTISEVSTATVSMAPITGLSHYQMPNGYPGGMSYNFVPEGYHPVTGAAQTTPIMTVIPPLVHTVPQAEEPIYQVEPNERGEVYDDFQDQFQEMRKEIKALKGKNSFGKNAYDMCLVPNVKIPAKFKVPDFEKYKGSSCPQSHLTIYCRKMATHTDDDKLLIHYFQDSLTGAALKWYMGLDSTHISSFDDLVEAFIRQYKYNVDMAPDRDQLRAMAQKEKESFKEYAQRWREVAAQISPPMEEKEMTKMFLKTLSSFYYEKMVASAPTDFTEMVNMGMRLEEGVREGRLIMESGSSIGTKKYGNNFQKKWEDETIAFAIDGGESHNSRSYRPLAYQQAPFISYDQYPYVAAAQFKQPYRHPWASPPHNSSQNAPQNAAQNRDRQRNQNKPQRNHQKEDRRIDPIPMTYAQLWPYLIESKAISPRPTRPAKFPFPKEYNPNVKCDFHDGISGHSIEDCNVLKEKVQDLVDKKILSFKDIGPMP
ncbi:uncharacterized protein LOC131597828 [Vicia villosa]|uniref:uncharacterized protein LOC131597828 n=1 Tax=Vicia villosa TaxID=3911 RepID=UPI00273B84E0|nr:uncharacterized protein LOC131597828 [Vicia villosa]